MALYIVATPIGNMEDITLRALQVLKDADIIAAEDTRRARNLLNRHEITTIVIKSYHEYNEKKIVPHILEELTSGKNVAVITNAGTPAISDPGFPLIRAAIEAKHEFVEIVVEMLVADLELLKRARVIFHDLRTLQVVGTGVKCIPPKDHSQNGFMDRSCGLWIPAER